VLWMVSLPYGVTVARRWPWARVAQEGVMVIVGGAVRGGGGGSAPSSVGMGRGLVARVRTALGPHGSIQSLSASYVEMSLVSCWANMVSVGCEVSVRRLGSLTAETTDVKLACVVLDEVTLVEETNG